MALTVTTTNQYTDLVTLSQVKTALGVTTSTAYDANLADIIDMASDSIRDHCGRTFRLQGYTETKPGDGSQYLKLKNYPIVEVGSVTLRGDAITDYEIADRDAGLLFRELGWEWTVAAGTNTLVDYPIPDGDLFKFSIVHAAGYRMPDNSTAAASSTAAVIKQLPGRLKKAALVTVVSWFKGQSRDEDIKSKKLGPLSIQWAMNNAQSLGLPAKAEALNPIPGTKP
jgi:hypothetical protein